MLWWVVRGETSGVFQAEHLLWRIVIFVKAVFFSLGEEKIKHIDIIPVIGASKQRGKYYILKYRKIGTGINGVFIINRPTDGSN